MKKIQNEKQEKLEKAMDSLRSRYGKNTLTFGTLLKEMQKKHDEETEEGQKEE